jgi:tetratricopeptide (TPR) repeat protein
MRAALGITLADIEAARSLRERPANPDAFDLILRARAIEILPQTKETLAETLSLYKQALERDPNAVLALTGAANMVLNVYFFGDTYGGAPHEEAMGRAVHYLERAQKLEPNAESVLVAWSQALDFQEEELDYRRARSEVTAIGRRLIDVYPNNPIGYFRLGVVLRDEGKYDEAAGYFAKAIRLSPRSPAIKTWYWSMAYCAVWAGHDREGLEWIERTMRAEGSLPPIRTKKLNIFRAVAYARTGAQETAKGLVKELKDRYPFETWRRQSPADPESETNRQQALSFMEVLRTAGMREHVDPDEDFGVAPEDVLHLEFEGKTATTAPGVTTVSTERLAEMLEHDKPLVIDSMTLTWHRSIPGAVALDFNEDAGGQNTGGTFADETQKRLERKLRELSDGDMAKPIVAVSWNAVSFAGYNLALRIRHAGYTNVYWYRGGREAWEVAGKPEDVVQPADW